MILVTGGAGFIGSNLHAALVHAATRPSSSTGWATRASGATLPATRRRRLSGRRPSTPSSPPARRSAWCSTWARSARRPRRMATWRGKPMSRCPGGCGSGAPRTERGSSMPPPPATYGDGTAGFDDDPALLNSLRPLNLYGWTKHAFDLRVMAAWQRRARAAAMGRAEILQRLRAERIPQRQDDLRREGQARRGRGRAAGAKLFRSDRPTAWRTAQQRRDFVWVGDVVDVMLWLLDRTRT